MEADRAVPGTSVAHYVLFRANNGYTSYVMYKYVRCEFCICVSLSFWESNEHCFQINWEVTPGGRDGIYNPTGNYYPTATNNIGTAFKSIYVKEAEYPGRPQSVTITSVTSQSITLAAEPPVEDNCLPVVGFLVQYKIEGSIDLPNTRTFKIGKFLDSWLVIIGFLTR